MAPQPKRKHSAARARVRTEVLALKGTQLISCASCKKPILSHRVCPYCGYYDGRLVVAQKVKKEKKNEDEK